MTTTWVVALLVCALLFIAAGVWVLLTNVLPHKRWHWALISTACLSLAIFAARSAWWVFFQPAASQALDGVNIGLVALAALLTLGSVGLQTRTLRREQQTRQAFEGQLAHYKVNFEHDPRLLVIKNTQGEYLAANPAYTNFLGKNNHALIGENDLSYFPRSTANALRQQDEKTWASRAETSQEIELIGVQGPCWFQLTRIPLFDRSGELAGLLQIGKDLSIERSQQAQNEAWQSGVQTLLDNFLELFRTQPEAAPFQRLVAWAERLASSELVGLWSFHNEGAEARLTQASPRLESLLSKKLKTGEDLAWKVWKSGQACVIQDYAAWPDANAAIRKTGARSGIGVPLKAANRVAHVLGVYYDSLSPALAEPRAGLLTLLAQAAFDSFDLHQRLGETSQALTAQQQKEHFLGLQATLEHALANLAIQFINLDEKKFDEAVRQALKGLARHAGADRAFLAMLPDGVHTRVIDLELLSATSNPGTATLTHGRGEFLLQPNFRWAMEKMDQLEPAAIGDASQLPLEDQEGLPFMTSRQLSAFAAVPLAINRSFCGILGLEAFEKPVLWSQEVLAALTTAAELFSNLLEWRDNLRKEDEARQELRRQIDQLTQRNRDYGMINEMSDLLQACRTADEAYPIIKRYLQRLLPDKSGAIYIFNESSDPAEKVVSWGIFAPGGNEQELTTNECWGLRRGRSYLVKNPESEPVCGHIREPVQSPYLCTPMMGQGRAIGVLHLRAHPGADPAEAFDENQQYLARRSAEYIAMAMINLRLRDELRGQAIRDPLTGLFNRRYMEETLEREIRRALRHSTNISVIMFDIDRLKPINDKFGHDAGDHLLKSLGATLQGMFRGEDVACRYGGDEFTVVLPEASLADTWRRADQMRKALREMDLTYEGHSLGPVTVSIGLASFPEHGQTAERLLLTADAASYAAKTEGGDRIAVGKGPD